MNIVPVVTYLRLDRCFRYLSLQTEKLQDGIPTDMKPELTLKLEMIQPATIIGTQDQEIGRLDEVFLLNGANCVITFRRDPNRHVSLLLHPNETRWHSITQGICSFSKIVDSYDIEYLTTWRQGETVSIYWRLEGYAILNDNRFDNISPDRILPFNVNNINDPISMGPDVFTKEILLPAGLGEKFIAEFAVQIPPIIQSSTALPKAISSLKPYLLTLLQFIKSSLETLRNARTEGDIKGAVGAIRTPLDTVLNYKNQQGFPDNLARELFIDTNVVRNIPGISNGAQQAANEMTQDIWRHFQIISNMCSKVLHTTPKQQRGQIKSSFLMEANRFDAEYLLISSLSTTNYLIRIIENTLVKR